VRRDFTFGKLPHAAPQLLLFVAKRKVHGLLDYA
jgi:hypothetical protein